MIKRKLSIPFQKSVGDSTQKPEVIEVVVIPLSSPSSSQDNIVLTGGKQVQKITLTDPVTIVEFELVPTDAAGLSERILYRVGWRTQFLGRTYTTDFAMPDFDVSFDDLQELSAIITGETYLQQEDLGVAGRVAKLDDDGDLVDAFGVKITGIGNANTVDGKLNNEIVNRQQADNSIRILLEQELAAQIESVLSTAQANLILAVGVLEGSDLTEKTQRIDAVNTLNSTLDDLTTDVNAQLLDLTSTTASNAALLLDKADLVDGKVPSSQLPALSLITAVAVADEAGMLALTTDQVQPGDLAVRSDGSWLLLQNPPSVLGNWIKTSTGGEVLSVNGQIGAVVLAASDIGARSDSVQVPIADVVGLEATNTSVEDHKTRITTIENDPLIVRLNEFGVIETSLLSDEMAYVNEGGVLVTKDGTPIVVTGSGAVDSVNGFTGIVTLTASDVGARPIGVSIPAAEVTDLETALGDLVYGTDPRLTDSRDPNLHKASHSLGGADALAPSDIGARALADNIDILEITNLDTTLTSQGNRVNSLENRVDDLEDGTPANTGASRKTAKFDFPEATADFSGIVVDSPFGNNPTNPFADVDGNYYDPSGAADGEGLFPIITPNGHLELRKRNEANPVDPVLATQDELDSLTTTVGGKTDSTDFTALSDIVTDKADQSDFNTLSDTVGTKADQSALDATNITVAAKANQSSLDITNNTVATKANQSALDTTNNTVTTKANETALTTATDRITAVENTLPNKADLIAGEVLLTQIPTGIPTASIFNLDPLLAGKADLVGGKLSTSQLPTLSTTETFAVANKSAMLALTPTQVQVGDQCIITATADKGTYTLIASDPVLITNWLKHTQPDDLVSSVNGQTGVVVLSSSDVGARSSVDPVPQADVDGLDAALSSKADASDLTTGLSGKTSPADVNGLIGAATICKQLVGRVSVSNVVSLSGQQSIDGSLTPLGTVVLLTAQTSSIQNGIYTVSSGSWSRVSDMDNGSYFVKGTLALITEGASHANEFWQETSTSGTVGASANNWVFAMKAGPPNAYAAGDGLELTSTTFALKPLASGGIVATGSGASVDTNIVVRKYAVNITAGVNPASVTHGLATLDVQVTVRDIASGMLVLVPVTVQGLNTVTIDFSSTPTSNQYRVVIQG